VLREEPFGVPPSGGSVAPDRLKAQLQTLRRFSSAILIAALLFAAVFAGGCSTSSTLAGGRTFRVMTYNIHHGEGLDGKVDLPRIAELIQREGADIVALQEVDKGVERTGRRDLPAELAALTGMTCVFNNNFHYQGGEYGNAVLTRFPVTAWMNLHYQMLRTNEQRGLLQLTLNVHSHKLLFMNTHIDYRADDSERLLNVRQIQAAVKQPAGQPIILCGDFNDAPGSRTHRTMKETFDDTWELIGQGEGLTFSADKPHKRVDYIWISRDKSLVPLKVWVPQSDASDHLPVVAEFELR
jgi:endonuclease/exonuclease/phosphatase family metal-dependent hydrolase